MRERGDLTYIRHGALGLAFTLCIGTDNQNESSFSPYGPRLVSVECELLLECLRYIFTGIPPQSNSPPVTFRGTGREHRGPAAERVPSDRASCLGSAAAGLFRPRAERVPLT
jgi:hypothetical protein